jgi:uncharacterized repeat protein (TIGR01451 family)
VTAYTPSLDNYNRVTVPIFWVDAQFILPQSTTAEPGRPHVLTTTIVRRSDNAPLAGWTVRYDVASGASLGYEGGNCVEAKTDAAGRASVEVSPVNAGGGTTNVGISIYRPAAGGPGGTPPQGIGRGNVTITWGAGAPVLPYGQPAAISVPVQPPMVEPYTVVPPTMPYTPIQPAAPPFGTSPPASTFTPPTSSPPATTAPPSQPNAATSAPPPYTLPPGESTTGRPKFNVELRSTTPAQLAVGEYAGFEVVVTNTGDGTARSVSVRDAFPPGLRHDKAKPGATEIEYERFDLAPNQSKTVPLTFEIVAEGQQCHTATVSAEGADPVSKQGCVTGLKPAFAGFRITGHRSRTVGEKAQFDIVIKNGDLPARNVAVILKIDPALELVPNPNLPYERLQDGRILLKIGDMVANEQRTFTQQPIEAVCKEDNRNACVTADLMAGGTFIYTEQACVDILPAAPGGLGAPAP